MRTHLVRSVSALLVSVGLIAVIVGVEPAGAAEAPVGLGTAASFAVLGATTVTNTGPSVISGDVGVSPGTAITGFGPGSGTLNPPSTFHANDEVAAQAQLSATTAYNDAAGRSPSGPDGSPELAGRTLVAGVYHSAPTLRLNGTVTLNGEGDPNAVFIFQADSDFISGSGSTVALINGAQACNVYWKIGSSATLGTNSTFVGTVLALTSVWATTGASVAGRLLARNGEVTLDSNTITASSCATPPSTTTTGGSTTTTGGSTTTTTGGSTTTTAGGTTASGTGGSTSAGVTGPATGRATTASGTAGRGAGSATNSERTSDGASRGGSGTTGSATPPTLANTGSQLTGMALIGVLMISLGALIMLTSRRQIV